MRTLFLSHRVPYPPNKGEKIRAFHQLKALAARHEVDLFALADDARDLEHADTLREWCSEVTITPIRPKWQRIKSLPHLLTRQPLTKPYFYSSELQARVDAALASRKYDRIFVYCSAMAQYVEHVKDVPVIVDFVDVDSDKWAQYASFSRFPFSLVYGREGKLLREYEFSICRWASAVMVCTDREANLLSSAGGIFAVPNGVDTDYFYPQGPPDDPATIIFTGDMAYFPNQQAVEYFAREVFPVIRGSVPSARFLIVGRNPNQRVVDLRRIDGVEVTGAVPDVRPYFKRASVAVAPFVIAAGIQNKILEAMACGLPVVASLKVKQGLAGATGALVSAAHDSEDFAKSVSKYLLNRPLAESVGIESRRYVLGEYSWNAALDKFTSIIENPLPNLSSGSKSHVPQPTHQNAVR